MKRSLKLINRLLLSLLFLLLVVIALAYFLLGTDSGFSLSSKQASTRVDGLDLGKIKGNLADGIHTDQLTFDNASMSVSVQGLESQWRLSCLAKRELCVDRIIIDEVKVTTFATDKPPGESSGPIQLPAIELPVNASIDEVRIRQLIFQPPGEAPAQTINDLHLSVNTQGNQVFIEAIEARYLDYTAKLSGDVQLDGDYPLDLNLNLDAKDILPENLPEGDGEQAVKIEVQLSNTLRDLAVNTRVSGSVEASLTGTVNPLDKNLPASIIISSPLAGWPIESKTQVAASDTRISIDGTLDDYQLSLTTRVNGEQIPEIDISIEGQANTQRLTLPGILINTLDGKATGSAELSWTETLQWSTSWDIADINPALQIPDLNGSLSGNIVASGKVVNGEWTLDLPKAKITGVLKDYPFNVDANVSKGLNNVWLIDKLLLANGNNLINASGNVSEQWNIQAVVQLPEMQNLLPELAGGFNAEIDIQGQLDSPDVTLAASSSVVKYNDILVQGLSLNANINKLFEEQSNVKLAVGTFQSGEQIIRNTRLELAGQRDEHTLTLFADGPSATAIDLSTSGKLDETFNWNGSLNKVTLEVPAHTINLDEPTTLAWDNTLKKFAIDAHCWITEDSRLCLQNKVLAEAQGTAIVSLDQYPLNRLNPFMPADTELKGGLKLDSTIHWGNDQPGGFQATVDAQIANGGARVLDADRNPVNFTYDDLILSTTLDSEKVDANLTLSSGDLGKADIQFTLKPTGEDKPIEGTVSLQGLDIGVAKAFLPDFDEVSGTLSVEGDVSGQLTDPRFDGELILNKPVLRAEILPLPITGGRIVTTVKGKRAVIGGALNSDEGRINIDGSANWQQADAWNADVNLNGEALNVQSDPLLSSSINHKIRINAQPGIIRIDGDIDIPTAVIDVEDLPQGAASVSSDIVIIEDVEEEQAQNTEAASTSDTRVLVALNVLLGDEVNLSAYGLTARLTGDMSLRVNSPNPPQLGGEIQVVDGIYKQYGQNLEANGQILFVGPVNQTRLAIDAIREIDGEERSAGLRIQGTVATPEITLFTEPADKSQDAILSYIVLGRDINETSDQEANLLATAALALTVKGGRNIAGGIASAIGVKDFALETRGNGDDTELVVSGRLNDRLLLRYGRSVFEPESTLYLRYDLTKKLYLEAAQGAEQAVDLFYSFSF